MRLIELTITSKSNILDIINTHNVDYMGLSTLWVLINWRKNGMID